MAWNLEENLLATKNGYGRKNEGKENKGKPRQMMLNWMVTDGYGKLKQETQQREE